MAYMSQELKQKLAPEIKSVLKKYGVKGSLAVRHHMTLVLNIKSGSIDFIGNCNEVCGRDAYQVSTGFRPIEKSMGVNTYHYQRQFSGKAKDFLSEVLTIMNKGNHDRSDIQSDYFDVGWYVDVNIGQWNKPYILEK